MATYTEIFAKERFNESEQWIKDNLLMEVVMGSQAYGLSTAESDVDFVCLVMPKHDMLYPQAYGYVNGFEQSPNFNSKEIKGPGKKLIIDGIETEGEWNSLVKFFYLAGVKGSPNLLEVLFTRRALVKYSNDIGWMLRDNKDKFLSMKTFNAFKGYAFQQIQRIKRCVERGKAETPKRQEYLDKYGYDIKMAYHPLRLLDQMNQLLDTGTMDLMNNKEECKAMRLGEWGPWEKFRDDILNRLNLLEEKALRTNALLPKPQTGVLKQLLLDCIEEYYGSEEQMQRQSTEYVTAKSVMEKLDRIERMLSTP